MVILFLGPPGAGKSTQASLLQEKLGYSYIKTSDLLRKQAKKDPELAKIMNSGGLVPSTIVNKALEEYHQEQTDNVLLDAPARKPRQVDAIAKLWHDKTIVAIYIELPTGVIRERTRERHEGRLDDQPDAVEHRIEEYKSRIHAIRDRLEHFAIPVIKVNGNNTIENIHNQILKELANYDHSS